MRIYPVKAQKTTANTTGSLSLWMPNSEGSKPSNDCMSEEYVSPEHDSDGFHCPHCQTYAYQGWKNLYYQNAVSIAKAARCSRCEEYSIWVDDVMVYPKTSTAPVPHEDMPENVERDFQEARLVLDDSPRSAAALLRLAIQRLLDDHLEVEDSRIYDQIGTLVEENQISPRVQKALDSVRVVGNNSVHPGEMDMDDNRDTALALFKLVNVIVDETIGRDNRIDGFYETLPEGPKNGIENRDE